MSREIITETLKAMPEDALVESHLKVIPRFGLTREDSARFSNVARPLHAFGLHLMAEAYEAGWDGERPEIPYALRSGSDRLFLSTLRWLKPKDPTPAQTITRRWLVAAPLLSKVESEIFGLTKLSHDTDAVAYEAEDQLAEYRAFVSLGQIVEADLYDKYEIDLQVGAHVRLGVALAGLAIMRTLEPQLQPKPEPEVTAEPEPPAQVEAGEGFDPNVWNAWLELK